MTGIADMFAELDGYDRMWMAVAIRCARIRAARNAYHREYLRAWKRRNPDKLKAQIARYTERHPDIVRARWRRAAEKKRDKARADRELRVYRCRVCGEQGHNALTCAQAKGIAA